METPNFVTTAIERWQGDTREIERDDDSGALGVVRNLGRGAFSLAFGMPAIALLSIGAYGSQQGDIRASLSSQAATQNTAVRYADESWRHPYPIFTDTEQHTGQVILNDGRKCGATFDVTSASDNPIRALFATEVENLKLEAACLPKKVTPPARKR